MTNQLTNQPTASKKQKKTKNQQQNSHGTINKWMAKDKLHTEWTVSVLMTGSNPLSALSLDLTTWTLPMLYNHWPLSVLDLFEPSFLCQSTQKIYGNLKTVRAPCCLTPFSQKTTPSRNKEDGTSSLHRSAGCFASCRLLRVGWWVTLVYEFV